MLKQTRKRRKKKKVDSGTNKVCAVKPLTL